MGDAVKCPLLEHSFNLLALTGSAAFKRVDHSHGYFSFAQIAGYGLAENIFGCGKVEHVISDLKRHTEIVSILRQTFFLLACGAAEDSAHAHAYGKQACGFSIDEVKVLVQRNQFAELFHLQEFTFHHLLGQINQCIQNAEVAFLHSDFERLHVQPVTG